MQSTLRQFILLLTLTLLHLSMGQTADLKNVLDGVKKFLSGYSNLTEDNNDLGNLRSNARLSAVRGLPLDAFGLLNVSEEPVFWTKTKVKLNGNCKYCFLVY